MGEGSEVPKLSTEGNRLVEKIGKNKLRALAALGMAAAGFFGVGGGINTGAGVAVETTNPLTGEPVSALVNLELTNKEGGWQGLGVSDEIMKRAKGNGEIYTVRVGGASINVGFTELEKQSGVVLLAIHPAAAAK